MMQFQHLAMPPLIAIVGATAAGKTALSIPLAQVLGAEIISADSRQIYRGLDIGTAKPTPQQLATVPHHGIDLINPDEPFSLALYCDMAHAAITQCHAKGSVPLLVGGTGQYLAALLQGWNVPRVPPNDALRAELFAYAETYGTHALYERLAHCDPLTAATIFPTNTRRIVRAMEVFEATGLPLAQQQTRTPPPFAIRTIWLQRPRPELYARIDARVDQMMEQGLLDEVQRLRAQGYAWELPALSSLGYVQFRPYETGASSLADCVQRLKFQTHAFARRQDNWFRRLPNLALCPVPCPVEHVLTLLAR